MLINQLFTEFLGSIPGKISFKVIFAGSSSPAHAQESRCEKLKFLCRNLFQSSNQQFIQLKFQIFNNSVLRVLRLTLFKFLYRLQSFDGRVPSVLVSAHSAFFLRWPLASQTSARALLLAKMCWAPASQISARRCKQKTKINF